MQYFSDDLSLDEGKSLFRKLVKENHPDLGGDAAVTADIINQFDKFCNRKMAGAFNQAGDDRTQNFKAEVFAEVLREAMKLNCRIELIGFWIYAFESFEVKDQLKAMGFFFSGKHKAWIFNGGVRKPFKKSRFTTDENRQNWGCQIVREKEELMRIA